LMAAIKPVMTGSKPWWISVWKRRRPV
jgi:hypothetical protein